MPALKAEVGSCWVANEVIVVDSLEGLWTQPSVLLSIEILERLRSVQHLSVGVEDALEMPVDLGNAEEGLSVFVIRKIQND